MTEQTTPAMKPKPDVEYVAPETNLPENMSVAEIAEQSKNPRYGNAAQSMTLEGDNE